MLNSGPTRAAWGNIAMARAIDSSSRLPGKSSRAMAYAANIAMTTDSRVAMKAMPMELRSALVNNESVKTVAKLFHVHSLGKNDGAPDTISDGGLKARLIIQRMGNSE